MAQTTAFHLPALHSVSTGPSAQILPGVEGELNIIPEWRQ